MKARAAVTLALALVACAAPMARAQEAAPDTSLHQFLHTLSDSTDAYFGMTAAPLDTAGLDSALAVGLSRPWRGQHLHTHFGYAPVLGFNRVDGSVAGGSASLSSRRWRLLGDLAHAGGTHLWVGGGEAWAGIRRHETLWGLRVRGGRRTAVIDRDVQEKKLAALRALITGDDHQHYFRRDGYEVAFTGDGPTWSGALGFRDMLESPLPVTTTWDLAKRALEVPWNVPAAFGRAREATLTARVRVPFLPLTAQLSHQTSDGALGSDFDYRRTRVALGGEFAVGGHVSFLPQLVYGRLGGDAVPQASFYLGGARTLRSLPGEAIGGTGLALARLDVILADDLLALAHIPHPAMFPLQAGVFAASGAVWGADPYGGPGSAAGDWPQRQAWLSEAGVSLLYRPGVPDDDGYFRLNYAFPLGGDSRDGRWSVSYSRALDLLRPF